MNKPPHNGGPNLTKAADRVNDRQTLIATSEASPPIGHGCTQTRVGLCLCDPSGIGSRAGVLNSGARACISACPVVVMSPMVVHPR